MTLPYDEVCDKLQFSLPISIGKTYEKPLHIRGFFGTIALRNGGR